MKSDQLVGESGVHGRRDVRVSRYSNDENSAEYQPVSYYDDRGGSRCCVTWGTLIVRTTATHAAVRVYRPWRHKGYYSRRPIYSLLWTRDLVRADRPSVYLVRFSGTFGNQSPDVSRFLECRVSCEQDQRLCEIDVRVQRCETLDT